MLTITMMAATVVEGITNISSTKEDGSHDR